MPKLVIVESPAKAKTISKYLGRGYKVTASMGHVRDLPASQLGIDVDNGFAPKYITIKGKQKLVKELKAEAKKCDGVLLATDPDREGEAISWHLANILGLDPAAPNRVTFDEITKKGVKEGMAHPRAINIDLFNAQQARRELDRLVGYKLSPFLWRKVRRGLSAGRVQSVAVRLIRDRELEIENFKPDEYWNIDAALYPQTQSNSKNGFTARLAATADGKKLTVTNKEQAGLYARTDKVHYLPQPVYRHFESGQSTSQCQTVQALQGRIGVLDRWMTAEYKAIQARCPEAARAAVWNDRRAQAITFLMHQLADAKAPGTLRRHGWRTLRGVLARYPAPPLDLWHEAKHHKKQTGALLLYNLRLQRLYELWANRPKNRRRKLP